jgi:hypothetical protein
MMKHERETNREEYLRRHCYVYATKVKKRRMYIENWVVVRGNGSDAFMPTSLILVVGILSQGGWNPIPTNL